MLNNHLLMTFDDPAVVQECMSVSRKVCQKRTSAAAENDTVSHE